MDSTNHFPISCQDQGISTYRGGGKYKLKHLDGPHATELGVLPSKIQGAIRCNH